MKTASPGFPRFYGPFKKFSLSVSTNREKGIDRRLLVYSQGSRAKVVKFLWLKYLWDELTKKEFELFMLLPETINSEIKVAALRAVLILGKRKVREAIINCPVLPESERPTREQYQGFKRLDVEISDFTRSLRRVPKFKGWIKSSSAKDSKRTRKSPSCLEPLAVIDNDYEDNVFDWYNYLTVVEFSPIPKK
jgi:hypothetical protein